MEQQTEKPVFLVAIPYMAAKDDLCLLVMSVLPGIMICFMVVKMDLYQREPIIPLFFGVFCGALLTIPAVWIEEWVHRDLFSEMPAAWTLWFKAFIGVALTEEMLKFLVVYFLYFKQPFFDEPMDGIVYCVLVGMGFVSVENFFYAERFGIESIFIRLFSAVPLHLVAGLIQGYYIGLAKFQTAKRKEYLATAILASLLIHGTYDLLIFQNWSDWLFVLGVFSVYLCLFYSGKLVKDHLDNSPFR
jgi:RsiW-degrading membrane proteinase PrsW (M82 family)